jgi:hypothetical protein
VNKTGIPYFTLFFAVVRFDFKKFSKHEQETVLKNNAARLPQQPFANGTTEKNHLFSNFLANLLFSNDVAGCYALSCFPFFLSDVFSDR